MLNVGLLGAGRIGNVHAKAILAHPQSRLIAVSDVNAEAATTLAAASGAEARTSEAILADKSIETKRASWLKTVQEPVVKSMRRVPIARITSASAASALAEVDPTMPRGPA